MANRSYNGGHQQNQRQMQQWPAPVPLDFVNPYNFIPFGEKPEQQSVEEVYGDSSALQSGWLDVRLDVKTPLIIPDGAHPTIISKGAKNEHRSYRFFTVPNADGKSVETIPGSSLRGMLRSIYEAASNSCLPLLMDDKPISQRNPLYAGFSRRGLLEYNKEANQWLLYSSHAHQDWAETFEKATESDGTYHGKHNGEYVAFDENEYGMFIPEEDTEDMRHGWLQYNKPVNDKQLIEIKGKKRTRGYYFTVLTKADELFTWVVGDDTPCKSLESALHRDGVVGNQNNPNAAAMKALYRALQQVKQKGGCVPVWYLLDNEKKEVYLSGASIGRVGRRRRWKEIMENHIPCNSMDALCPACLLFGTTRGKHKDSPDSGLRGRLRFTDASPIKITGKEFHTLQILGGPRTSAFEFYLDKPNEEATYWNFDYYSYSTEGEQHDFKALEHATPRGRKMYWHGKTVKDRTIKDKQNATMEAVNTGSSFRFRVYFDRITEPQLQDLIWTITLGENTMDSTLQHKLGHARPLGYGSVKLTIEKNGKHIRSITVDENANLHIEVCHSSVEQNPICSFRTDCDPVKSLLTMCNTEAVADKEVCYPICAKGNKEEIFLWFAQNRMNKESVQTLPKPTDSRITLRGSRVNPEALRADQNANNRNNQYQAEERIPNGTIVEGVTNGMNKSGRYVFIRLKGKRGKASARTDKVYLEPVAVRVRVCSYNERHNNYDVEILS